MHDRVREHAPGPGVAVGDVAHRGDLRVLEHVLAGRTRRRREQRHRGLARAEHERGPRRGVDRVRIDGVRPPLGIHHAQEVAERGRVRPVPQRGVDEMGLDVDHRAVGDRNAASAAAGVVRRGLVDRVEATAVRGVDRAQRERGRAPVVDVGRRRRARARRATLGHGARRRASVARGERAVRRDREVLVGVQRPQQRGQRPRHASDLEPPGVAVGDEVSGAAPAEVRADDEHVGAGVPRRATPGASRGRRRRRSRRRSRRSGSAHWSGWCITSPVISASRAAGGDVDALVAGRVARRRLHHHLVGDPVAELDEVDEAGLDHRPHGVAVDVAVLVDAVRVPVLRLDPAEQVPRVRERGHPLRRRPSACSTRRGPGAGACTPPCRSTPAGSRPRPASSRNGSLQVVEELDGAVLVVADAGVDRDPAALGLHHEQLDPQVDRARRRSRSRAGATGARAPRRPSPRGSDQLDRDRRPPARRRS